MSTAESSSLRFDDEVVIVTGGGGALGSAYARDLASRGARVIVNDLPARDDESTPAALLVEELVASGAEAVLDEHDVVHESGAIVEQAISTFGRLDIVIANAGISSTPWNSGRASNGIGDVPPDQFDHVSDTTYKASARILHHAWRHLEQRAGRVILTSSGSIFGVQQSASYIASKSALIGLTRTLAMDGAPYGVRVNGILPIAWSRLLGNLPGDAEFMARLEAQFTAERVADVVTWLVHRDTPISGESVSAGGGLAARLVLGVTHGWRDDTGRAEGFVGRHERVLGLDQGLVFPADALEDLNFKVGRAMSGPPAELPLLTWPSPAPTGGLDA